MKWRGVNGGYWLVLTVAFYVSTIVERHWHTALDSRFNLDSPQIAAYVDRYGDACLNQVVVAIQRSQSACEGVVAAAVLGLATPALLLLSAV